MNKTIHATLFRLSLLGVLLLHTSAQATTLIQYDFDTQLTSQSYADQSGNGHTVNFNRVVGHNPDYPFTATYPGLAGEDFSAATAYNAGTNGNVSGGGDINLNTNNQFTMEGWVYPTGIATVSGNPVGGSLWRLQSTIGGSSDFSLVYTDDRTVQVRFNSESQPGGALVFDTSITLALDTWTHLAYVKTTGGVLEVYLNGTLVDTFQEAGITSRSLPSELTSVVIGNNIFGRFDDFRLSDVALTAEQLGYWAPFTPIPEPGPVALVVLGLAGAAACVRRRRAFNAKSPNTAV